MLIAVNYHYVRPVFDSPYPGIHGITPERLESQLTLLSQAGQFVSGSDILEAVRGGKQLPSRALVITFDDGLCEQFDHAVPVLRRLGIPALFFVNTRPTAENVVSSVHKIHLLRANVAPDEFLRRLQFAARERGIQLDAANDAQRATEHYKYDEPEAAKLKYLLNMSLEPADRDVLVESLFGDVFSGQEATISRQLYMTKGAIAELGREQSIGTHAHEHLPLGQLSDDEASRQLSTSIELIDRWTGNRPVALSYPYGSREASTSAAAAAATRLGIEFAFTMERAGNPNFEAPMHLARFDNNDLPGGKAARCSIDELFATAASRSWYTETVLASKQR